MNKKSIFFSALIARILCVLAVPMFPDQDESYITLALNLVSGKGYGYWLNHPGGGLYWRSWVMPLLSMQYHFIACVVGKNISMIHDVSAALFILLGALACVVVVNMAEHLGLDRPYAYAAGWIMALSPSACLWSTRFQPMTLMNFFLVMMVMVLLMEVPFAAGLMAGLATLARAEIMAIWIPVLAWYLVKKQGMRIVPFMLAMALVLAPWVVRNYRVHHKIIIGSLNYGDNVWFAHNVHYDPVDPFAHSVLPDNAPELQGPLRKLNTEVEADAFLAHEGLRYCRENPRILARTTLIHLWHYWRPWLTPRWVPWYWNILYTLTTLPILILFAVGMATSASRDWLLLKILVLWHCLIHLPFYVVIRFRENMLPFIILLAIMGLKRKRPARLTGRFLTEEAG